MRRLVLAALVVISAVAVTLFAGVGSLRPPRLNPLKAVSAAGSKVIAPVRSAIGGSIVSEKAQAAGSTPQAPVQRDGMTVYFNVIYGNAGGQALLLDAYIPDGGPHPGVVVIHGGGWAYGDKRAMDFEGNDLARAGFAAFVVDYRMAPPGGHWHAPVALDDVRTAVRWVRQNADKYGVDPTKVGALGNSAGGNLAMMLGTTGTAGSDRADAVVSYSGQSDLLRLSTRHTVHAADNYLGCTLVECQSEWIANSPVYYCNQQTSPMLVVNSTHELMPLDQATIMDAKLTAKGVPHELRILPGNKHASAYANIVWPQTIAFFHQYLGGS